MAASKPENPPRTKAQQKEDAEREIILAALELIYENGITNTTFARIGERSGYSRGLVTYHFKNKAGLLERVVRYSEGYFEHLSEISKSDQGLDRLLKIVDAYVDLFLKHESVKPALIVMWGAALAANKDKAAIEQTDEVFRDFLKSLIKDGQHDGSIRAKLDTDTFAFLLTALLRGIGGAMLVSPTAVKGAKAKRQLREFIGGYLQATEG